jgi:hypothetical protein
MMSDDEPARPLKRLRRRREIENEEGSSSQTTESESTQSYEEDSQAEDELLLMSSRARAPLGDWDDYDESTMGDEAGWTGVCVYLCTN